MGFLGKATYGAGVDLPELAEDVSDIVGIVSPYETPLLDHLGDAKRAATSPIHEWIEDTLTPNFDAINQSTFTPNAQDATSITVNNGSRFQVGDLVRPGNASEVLQVGAVVGNVLTVTRRFGSTPASSLANGLKLWILGNAAIEGSDSPAARYTSRVRRQNYSQIFMSTIDVTGTMQAARSIGVQDEFDYQKQERLRELMRDLENCVLNGTAPASNPQGSSSVRRSMNGILRLVSTNQFVPGQGSMPAGGGSGSDLNEPLLNAALRSIWEQSSGTVDTIVCGGLQKRKINQFISTSARAYTPEDRRLSDLVSVYESDFGVCRVILSRWMPADAIALIDSSRVQVMPMVGRSFHFKPLAATGDSMTGMLVGEYTLEFKNENAHGVLRGLSTT